MTVSFDQDAAEAIVLLRVLDLYANRGMTIGVACSEPYQQLFAAAGWMFSCRLTMPNH